MPDHWATYLLWTGLTPGSEAWGLMWLFIFLVLFGVPYLLAGGVLMAHLLYSDWNRSRWDDGPHRPWWWGYGSWYADRWPD